MKRMWKVVFSLMLLTVITGISSYMGSFAVSQESIWDEKLRPKSLYQIIYAKQLVKVTLSFLNTLLKKKIVM